VELVLKVGHPLFLPLLAQVGVLVAAVQVNREVLGVQVAAGVTLTPAPPVSGEQVTLQPLLLLKVIMAVTL
jgi:hypothetical protein